MTNAHSTTTALRRPRILVSAARHGCNTYNRARDLPRLIGFALGGNVQTNVKTLTDQEHQMEEKRKTGDAAYSITRHIELLVALLSEMKLQKIST
ncbi:MAG: DUF6477 family protein [Pseudoruegeria sp.]